MPLPDTIRDAPELPQELLLFYLAWAELDSTRPIGLAAGTIPWTAIRDWCDAHDIVGEQREDVFFHVRELDNWYLRWSSSQKSAKSTASPSS